MKHRIEYLALFLAAFSPWAQASQTPGASTAASIPQNDCKRISNAKVVNASASLRVTVLSCPNGHRIVAERTFDSRSVVVESPVFDLPDGAANEVSVSDGNTFDVGFLQSRSYVNPSLITYSFRFRGGRWLLEEMSFQATQSCRDEAGVNADYYDANYLTGNIETRKYEGCDHFKTQHSATAPIVILLEGFHPSDDRLSAFRFP